MENTNNKIVTVSFMVAGILVGIVVSVLVETLAAVATGEFGRIVAQDSVRHGLPVVVGFLLYLSLQFNQKVASWADEVVTEIRRVIWPSRKDTTAMTIVVCIMLLISGVTLGAFDVFSGFLIDWLLDQTFMGIFS